MIILVSLKHGAMTSINEPQHETGERDLSGEYFHIHSREIPDLQRYIEELKHELDKIGE